MNMTTTANDNGNKMPFGRHTHSITIELGSYQDRWLCTPPKSGVQQWAEDLVRRERGTKWGKFTVSICTI
jgi:hypothetical protein